MGIMKSNNERGSPTPPQSRSRATLGAECKPLVLYPGVRSLRRSGFLSPATAPFVISLEMTPERVRANLKAVALKP